MKKLLVLTLSIIVLYTFNLKADNNTLLVDWQYNKKVDKMRGTNSYTAAKFSLNTVDLGFPYNNSKMIIMLRNINNTINVLLNIKGQFVCLDVLNGCSVKIKFDDGPIEEFKYKETNDGDTSTVFIDNANDFINKLKKAKHVFIEANLYDHGLTQYEFDVSGLKWDFN